GIRIWANDLAQAGRYRTPTHDTATQCPLTNQHAQALLLPAGPAVPADTFCGQPFPQSIAAMTAWSADCDVRIGFLDPDAYVGNGGLEPGKVDSAGHTRWLNALRSHGAFAVGVMFFASQNALGRPTLVASFHGDALGGFPRSIVFRFGNFMVGVKLP